MSLDDFNIKNNWIKKCTTILLEKKNRNPFPKPPIAINFYNNPPLFCYGRDEQKSQISDEILDSINNFQPKLIRIMGKQGIGKSTLICSTINELSKSYDLPIVYLETSGQPEDFKMKSIYRQLALKIEKAEIINKIVTSSIKKFIETFKNAGGTLYEKLSNKFSGEEIKNLISDHEYIGKQIKISIFNQKIFDLLENNALLLKDYISVDLNFLLIFWKSHVQNPKYMKCLSAFRGNESYLGYNVQTDNDASKYIDEFIEFIRWIFEKKSTFIIIFDHLEAGGSEKKKDVFSNLFSLLLNLRQKKFLTIILSGTLDAYNDFDIVLQEDQQLQLDNWSKTIALTSLDPDIVLLVISQYLRLFWDKFNFHPPPERNFFPFGLNSIKYLYENNGLDLRKTLKNLYEIIEKYKINQKLEYINTFFKAFRFFRDKDDLTLRFIEQKEFRERLLDSNIQDKIRSTRVELAIHKLFHILKDHPDYYYLTDALHEPSMGRSCKKPDVFLEFFANEGLEYVKKIGIEVKMYRVGKEISKKDIEKTYILLKEQAIDYVIWISNVPLDIRYRYNLPEELQGNLGRLNPLDNRELAYISLITYFDEVFNDSPSIEQIEFLLNKIGLSPIYLKNKLKDIPRLTEIPKISTKKVDITSFAPILNENVLDHEDKAKIIPEISSRPVDSIELGLEQVKICVRKYINDKSKTNQRITSSNTIKSIKKSLNLADNDTHWNDEIWSQTIELSKDVCIKCTPKTIFFS